jgi:uncharacterized membrane protein YvlD (DUF360 family)
MLSRLVGSWLIGTAAVLVLDGWLDGLTISSRGAALGWAAVVGVLNALVWPLLIRVALPVTVYTLGLGVLVLNGLVVWASAAIVPGVTVSSLGTGIVITLGLTFIMTLVTSILAIDDDPVYFRNVVRRQARRQGVIESDIPAVFFLEIDGLAHDVLQRAVRDGNGTRWAAGCGRTRKLLLWE